jgi:hypothetical protein
MACGQSECVSGLLRDALSFQPKATSWRSYFTYFRVQSVACLNCGFIASYLSETDAKALRLKAAEQRDPADSR